MSARTSFPLRVGSTPLHTNGQPVEGKIVEIDGDTFYRIDNVDRMPPFFVTVVSAGNPWLFASSTGALTAGRCSPEQPLFPYETVDRIHHGQETRGGKTLVLVLREGGGEAALWEPFSKRYAGVYRIRRSLSKTLRGDRLRYEEVNDDLGLTFVQTWATSERYGFVRTAEILNHGDEAASVRLLDGVQHLMPYGISLALQNARSVLADAYKRSERLDSGLGIFALSAIPVDRAEPSEALLATTVFQTGLTPDAILLSSRQLDAFRRGEAVQDERLVRAERGAYFVHASLDLTPRESRTWDLVADIEQDASDVVHLDAALEDPAALREAVHEDVRAGAERIHFLVAASDGEQRTADEMATARHRMNVLFNDMRGGIFDQGYTVHREAVRQFVAHHNAPVAEAHINWFDALPGTLSIQALRKHAEAGSAQLQRLIAQYLPLHFSRRHGDPSRPWNLFAIETHDEDGSYSHGYEGNWRDIFQNWEALARSFPGYLEGMVTMFVNASTADGYNPYRITDEGIDWETVEPDDPWSYIGYWGDHQIIYLLRLLVQMQAHAPETLASLLSERRFSYANVPYRIAPYESILRDPQDTVHFDDDEEERIHERVEAVGADGKLLWDASGEVRLVTLAEKLLVPLLAKLTNFVPGGGIWMNTQRPEWNDANNALVGNGVSMVTLFAVRRHIAFLRDLMDGTDSFAVSAEVEHLRAEVASVLNRFAPLADSAMTEAQRREVTDALGTAGSTFRQGLYRDGLSGDTREVSGEDIRAMFDDALALLDASIRENRREDGLYHAYNLLVLQENGMGIEPLYAMLEGQVAALDAGVLSPGESLSVLQALRKSAMYRADQHSYTLYPDRALPGFLEKNTLPADALDRAPLLARLLDAGDPSVVTRDVRGHVHFNGTFRNANDVSATLDALPQEIPEADRQAVLDVFEAVFHHHAFTGRSGTFFGYEGLGSIYWHMVSKLALATQETFFRAAHAETDAATLGALGDAYYDIRAGLGGSKSPENFGAFPADAYSHTPGHAGAKQPGLTGQVKEDILCRWGELGVLVKDGRIVFQPLLLRAEEFVSEATTFEFIDTRGERQSLDLEAGSLGFTLCATPVVYRRADALRVRLVDTAGHVTEVDGAALSRESSAAVFGRTGAIARIEVDVPPAR
ncbi:MAG: hypothetical protein AAGI52_18665 [Bacteroidota bacterium]